MKRYGNLYSKIYAYENLKLAHFNARKNKIFYEDVKMVDANEDEYLIQLQNMLIWKEYKTSPYEVFTKFDSGKEREIYKLPYYPDRICHWAIMQQIEFIFMEVFTDFTHAAIKDRGIHSALSQIDEYMRDEENSEFCFKADVRKFFPNIDHQILKDLLRKKIKDEGLLWLLFEIIDSLEDAGVPIGNYLSQYFANFYLAYFDHWLKEEKKVNFVRYMDDICIFHSSKEFLHGLEAEIKKYLWDNLKLELKDNYQVFPSRVRGVDFVGYRHFGTYILLRKSTYKKLRKKMTMIRIKCENGEQMSYSDWCCINSYKGWVMWCNGYNLTEKYITPLQPYCDKYYKEVIKGEGNKAS